MDITVTNSDGILPREVTDKITTYDIRILQSISKSMAEDSIRLIRDRMIESDNPLSFEIYAESSFPAFFSMHFYNMFNSEMVSDELTKEKCKIPITEDIP